MSVFCGLLMAEGQKLYLQDTLIWLPFSERGFDEGACSLLASAQTIIISPFLVSNHLSPSSPHLGVIPWISLAPCLQRGRFEIHSPVSLLGRLMNKPFLCCQSWHLRAWLAVGLASKPGLVVGTAPVCACSHFVFMNRGPFRSLSKFNLSMPHGM